MALGAAALQASEQRDPTCMREYGAQPYSLLAISHVRNHYGYVRGLGSAVHRPPASLSDLDYNCLEFLLEILQIDQAQWSM